jgi:hypothetical protein
VSAKLKDLDDALARLQAKQSNLADPAQEQRRREAAHHRQHMEADIERTLKTIETVGQEAQQLQTRVAAMKASGTADTSPQLAQRLRGLEVELDKKLRQYEQLLTRAKETIARLTPKIEWARRVEQGRTTEHDDDVDAGLRELGGGK